MGTDEQLAELRALASAALFQRRPADAGHFVDQAIRIVEEKFGRDDCRLVPVLIMKSKCLSQASRSRGEHEERIPIVSRALRIAGSADLDLRTIIDTYGEAGAAFQDVERLSESREMFRRALDGCMRGGARDADYFYLTRLAIVTTKLDVEQAVALWEQLVEMDAARNPGASSHVVTLTALGECLVAAGRPGEAIERWETALGIVDAASAGNVQGWSAELRAQIDKARRANASR